jgi:excisionase family DNA binding protein
MKEWITKKEFAALLGVTVITIERLMKSGKIAYYKSGTSRTCKVMFKNTDVQKYLNSIKVKMKKGE